MRAFEYARAATIDEAAQQLTQAAPTIDPASSHPEPTALTPENGRRFLAGGTDLLTLMKADIVAPSLLVDIKRAEDLPRGIERKGGGLTLGALTTLTEIEHSAVVRERYPALAQAVSEAATPQLRNMATIGGNLLQRPRCWYYRNGQFHCWLKGGHDCLAQDGENSHHAILGTSPCVAVHPSDAASALLAYDASVRLRGPDGERTVPVSEFFAEPTDDRRTETTLRPGELLLDIQLPEPERGAASIYLKAMDRKVWAFALAGVAAVVRADRGRIASARIVLSGVAPVPWRAEKVESVLVGQAAGRELFARAADAALADAHPLELNGYKLPLVRGLVSRAFTELLDHDTTGGTT